MSHDTPTDQPRDPIDTATCERARAGDTEAQRLIFTIHAPRVFRLALRMTHNADLAEDITQDVFLRVFDCLHQFRGESKFGTWIHRIGVSVTLNALRKDRATRGREVDLEAERVVTFERTSLDPDVRAALRRAVLALPVEQRIVVVMHDVEGYSHGEIATALGIGYGACRMRLTRARETLRTALHPFRSAWP